MTILNTVTAMTDASDLLDNEIDFVLDAKNFCWNCDARLDESLPSHCVACGENQA